MPIQYTLTDYTFKYRSDAPPSVRWGETQHAITALRNETVAAQLVVQGDQPFLLTRTPSRLLHWTPTTRVRLAVGALRGPHGRPAAGEVNVYFVGTVPADKGDKTIADPLLPDDTIEVPAHVPQAVWLSIRIPSGGLVGRYRLPLTLWQAEDFQDEARIGEAEIAIDVVPVTLPEPRNFTHHLDLWQHSTGVARGHGVPLWSKAHWELMERYARELARLGQKAITVIASDSPWAGQNCRRDVNYPSNLHEYNMARIVRRADGSLRFDFSRLDRYVQMYLNLGIDREIEVFGLLAIWSEEFGHPITDHPDNVRLACTEETTGRITWLRTQAELRQYVEALGQHLHARGWWGICRFASDEPSDVDLFRQRTAFLRSVWPDIKFKVPANRAHMMAEFVDEVADWIPILDGMAGDVEASRRVQATVQARGDRFYYYVCCHPPRPNNFVISPPIEGRTLGWFSAWARLDGFLRWAYTCWPADPWRRPGFRFPHWQTGDMFFVYPGKGGQPIRSIRNEIMLMGIQDYELIALARERAKENPDIEAMVTAALARIIRADLSDFTDLSNRLPETLYSLDPADYAAARQMLIGALTG